MNYKDTQNMPVAPDSRSFEDAVSLEPKEPRRSEKWHVSKSGYRFDRNVDVWRLDGGKSVNFGLLPENVSAETMAGLRRTLARYAEELSPGYTLDVFYSVLAFFRQSGSTSFDQESLLNYRANFSKKKEHRLIALKCFLLDWSEWRYQGLGKGVGKMLENMPLKTAKSGKAIRSSCPRSGPYTDLEFNAILDDVANLFQLKKIKLRVFCAFLLILFTGYRPIQIRNLRASDLVKKPRSDSEGFTYIIRMPRAKQQNVGFRESFRKVEVTESIYELVRIQSEKSISLFEEHFGLKFTQLQRNLIPIFPHKSRWKDIGSFSEFERITRDTPDWFHSPPAFVSASIPYIAKHCTARSERTGDYIHITARRLRYTKGTNLQRAGASVEAIARGLDHSDLRSAHVYTQNTVEEAKSISEIMAPALAPLAQAFAGKLIDSERDALRANDPHSRVKNGAHKDTGNCSSFHFCALGYRACYTCTSFEPWLEGAHEDVLLELLEERDRDRKTGVSEQVIQSSDRTLLAVTEVVSMCLERHREEGNFR